MAVKEVNLKKRSVTNDKGVLSGQFVYQVTTDRGDTEPVIDASSLLPNVGSLHPIYTMWCTKFGCSIESNGVEWTCTADYSSEIEITEDPLASGPDIDWDGEIYSEAVFQDRHGNAIVNSAGDYFIDPSPTREKTHTIVKIKQNLPSLPSWWITHRDVLNNSTITIDGVPIGHRLARVYRPVASKVLTRNGIVYREISIEIHIHRKGWDLSPLDAGFRKVEDGKRVQIKDENGDEPTTPVPLDGAGDVLDDPTPSNAVFLDFEIDDEANFSVFPGVN